jgi:hypothetical protein
MMALRHPSLVDQLVAILLKLVRTQHGHNSKLQPNLLKPDKRKIPLPEEAIQQEAVTRQIKERILLALQLILAILSLPRQ